VHVLDLQLRLELLGNVAIEPFMKRFISHDYSVMRRSAWAFLPASCAEGAER
jgi:hypothetical protein